MRRTAKWSAAMAATAFAMAGSAWAMPGPPILLSEQGQLINERGIPVGGEVTMTFSLYSESTSGQPLWQETRTVPVDEGFFSVMLGSQTPLVAQYFDGSPLFLGVQVENDPEMMPREKFVSVPYALLAGDVSGDIHPSSVTVNGIPVIDQNGNWVGPSSGLTGPQGPQGIQGPQGPQGAAGQSVIATILLPGDINCPYGGGQFVAGNTTTYACNGAPGADGPQGPQGVQGPVGPAGQSAVPSMLPVGDPNCPHGGTQFTIGNMTTYACNGADGAVGPQGPAGADGQSVVADTVAVGDPNCPTGGSKFVNGSTITYACNGTAGPQGPQGAQGLVGPQGPAGADGVSVLSSTLPVGDANCPHGGSKFVDGNTITYACNGADGATGPQGPVGLTGPQGPIGLTGPQGPAGADGVSVVASTLPVGDANCPNGGSMFVDGNTTTYACNGAPGATGPQGSIGLTGPQGPQGPIGLTGPQGPAGADGAPGPQGPIGLTGPQGPIGLTGPQGPEGVQGPAGADGVSVVASSLAVGDANCPMGGSKFVNGSTITYACNGATGATGAAGPQGLQGPQGPAGADGVSVTSSVLAVGDPNCPHGGSKFVDGNTITYACNGADGATGSQGPIGLTGPQGPIGLTGPQGPAGADGVSVVASTLPVGDANCPNGGSMFVDGNTTTYACNGTTGATGPQGLQGPQGPAGADGVSVVATALPVGDANCPSGGSRFVDGNTITYACNGATGAVGPQGPIGLAGPQGPQGVQGPAGADGVSVVASSVNVGDPNCPHGGSMFVNGNTTTYACNGADGATGATGPQGPQGPIGLTGPQGPAGADGVSVVTTALPVGDANCPNGGSMFVDGNTTTYACNGAPGATGPQGSIGLTGPQGPQGPIGLTGPQGPAGANGAPGPQGPIGLTGPQGPQGPIGLTGPQGPAGADGASVVTSALPVGDANCPNGGSKFVDGNTTTYACNGATGATGATGPQGPAGANGISVVSSTLTFGDANCPYGGSKFVDGNVTTYACNGAPGRQGPAGPTGPQGPAGQQGAIGPAGPTGPAGPQGLVGAAGPAGPQGPIGPQGPAGPTGPQGPSGASVTATTLPVGDTNCPNGGTAFMIGTTTAYACNGATGPQGPAGTGHETSCPSPYTLVTLPHSTLCIYQDIFTASWAQAADACSYTYGGQLCSYDQMQRACSVSGYRPMPGNWLRDRTANDTVLYVNDSDCEDFDGEQNKETSAASAPTQKGAYCCLEWATY